VLRADVYLPLGIAHPLPVVVWLHPGGWVEGDRGTGPDLTRFFAERGFAMISIDYRLSSQAVFPAALEDIRSAIEWIPSIAGEYGLDSQRIGVWGSSAGGHLAALAALAFPELPIRAVVDAYGPTDFLQLPEKHQAPDSFESRFLGAPIKTVPQLVTRANPAAYARPQAPPFLLLHGLSDKSVPASQSDLLYEALLPTENDATLLLIEDLGHGFIEKNRPAELLPNRVYIREARPGLPEHAAEGPPLSFGLIETFFRKWLT
jgi:acetyl esterase/lipase